MRAPQISAPDALSRKYGILRGYVLFLSACCIGYLLATSIHKNNETNDKFYRKVAFLMYTEMVNFTPQS